jgi:hypothetical protein
MSVSGTDGDGVRRSGSLLSLAPRQPQPAKAITSQAAPRRAVKPTPSPILAALARAAEPIAETSQASTPKEGPTATVEATVERVAAEETVAVEEPEAEIVPIKDVRAEDVPAENTPSAEHSSEDVSPAAATPETAKGLVARLRRQFMEGLPAGRPGAANASPESAGANPAGTARRSALEEVRFRLSEFRTEILVRAAGRGKPSR